MNQIYTVSSLSRKDTQEHSYEYRNKQPDSGVTKFENQTDFGIWNDLRIEDKMEGPMGKMTEQIEKQTNNVSKTDTRDVKSQIESYDKKIRHKETQKKYR